jgi:hypothetical protein
MNENSNTDFFTNLEWIKSTEYLLISWADIALCYSWIFDKSYRRLNNINYRYTIPIIVMSTVTGTISMSLNSLLNDDQVKTGQIVLGGINIFIGILSTLQNFFRYAQLSEAHLTATRDWAKLHRNIKIELSIERKNRKSASEFVRSARQEYERLLNSRPVIPSSILMDFKRQYRNSDIIKPEVVEKIKHMILDEEKNIVLNEPQKSEPRSTWLNRMGSFITRNKSFTPRSNNISDEVSSESTFSEEKRLTVNTITPPPTPLFNEYKLSVGNPVVINLDKHMDILKNFESNASSEKELDLIIKIHEE